MESEKRQLNAILQQDVGDLLSKFGLLEAFSTGQLRCKFCKDHITEDNLYSVLPESGTANLICDKPDCVAALLLYLDTKKRKH